MNYVEVVQLVGNSESDGRKLIQGALRLQRLKRLMRARRALEAVEDPLADHIRLVVKQSIDRMQPQAAHAHPVAVGINQGNRQLAAPIFEDGPFFLGQDVFDWIFSF